jgi:hypothetical protein
MVDAAISKVKNVICFKVLHIITLNIDFPILKN